MYTAEEVQQKLVNGYVLYENEAVWVDQVMGMPDGSLGARVFKNIHNAGSAHAVSLKDLSFQDYILGYVNYPDGFSYYVVRIPIRRSRQAIGRDNLTFYAFRDGRSWELRQAQFSVPTIDHMLKKVSADGGWCFGDMIAGRYPSVNSAWDTVTRGNVSQVAFSKDFSLLRDRVGRVGLVYKNKYEIGWSQSTPEFWVTSSQGKWLREKLIEQSVKIKD